MINYYELAIGRWEGEGGALEAFRQDAIRSAPQSTYRSPPNESCLALHCTKRVEVENSSGSRIGSIPMVHAPHST